MANLRDEDFKFLTKPNGEKVVVVTSIALAKFIGISHTRVMYKIEGKYVQENKGILPPLEAIGYNTEKLFFKRVYDENKTNAYIYLCTKRGAQMVAAKQQGAKGITMFNLITDRFEEFEEKLRKRNGKK